LEWLVNRGGKKEMVKGEEKKKRPFRSWCGGRVSDFDWPQCYGYPNTLSTTLNVEASSRLTVEVGSVSLVPPAGLSKLSTESQRETHACPIRSQ
jgi:hypothetical protein